MFDTGCRAVAVVVALAVGAVACSEDSTSPTNERTIALAVATPSVILARGGSTAIAVTITRHGNYTGAVTLSVSGLPAGVTPQFVPPTVPEVSTSSSLMIAVSASAPAGTTVFTIHGTGVGADDAPAQVQLTITAAGVVAGAVR